MEDDQLFFNGVDGERGVPGVAPVSSSALLGHILSQPDPNNLTELRARRQQSLRSEEILADLDATLRELRAAKPGEADSAQLEALHSQLHQLERRLKESLHLGVREDIDADDLRQAGWGLIASEDESPEVLAALEPLLSLRRQQAGERFRLFHGARGYRGSARDSKNKFLVRSGGSASGPVSPEAVPYYLLIVGGPEKIPFEFQSQLDIQYAVGRVAFDSAPAYARYAQSVVAAETGSRTRPQRFTLFGVANPGDRATALSSQQLIAPLSELFASSEPAWEVQRIAPAQATKASLQRILHHQAPALLLSASHGLEFASGTAPQRPCQGAILCQDWPGPGSCSPIPRDCYLAAEDIQDEAQLHGLIWFQFACYSAGTPALDSFTWGAGRAQRAPLPFVAALPQRLLAHPSGGALAVIGHIDRAWGYSFTGSSPLQRVHTAAIESTLRRLLHGDRVGHATEYLNTRYAELACALSEELAAVRNLRQPDERALAELWTATHDARGYALLGDPAVRLSHLLTAGGPRRADEEASCTS
jgi:hypothetical protein